MVNFTRVEFSTDGVSWYALGINPIEIDLHDSIEVSNIETIDGTSIQQRPHFDSRVRFMVWKNLPQKDPYLTMYNTLKTYVGIGPIYMKLNRLDFDSSVQQRIKVINLTATISSKASSKASTKMIWEEIKLEYVGVPE